MSDISRGEGWWLASDGRWYPPESLPAAIDPDPSNTQRGGLMAKMTRQAETHADHLKKGAHTALNALEGSGIAKVNKKTGELKIKKLGIAKAALRPTKTFRKAIGGVAAEHLREPGERQAPS